MDLDSKIGINDLHVRHENGKYVIFYNKPIYVGEISEDELDEYEKEKRNDHLIIMRWLSNNVASNVASYTERSNHTLNAYDNDATTK